MKAVLREGFIKTVLSTITLLISVAQIAFGGSLNLEWNANGESDLDGYNVYYGTSSGSYGNPLDVGDVTEYELTGLNEGVRYYIAITAYDTSENESEKSDEESGVVPDTQDPTATITNPTSSSSYATSSSTITLGGSASDNVGVTQVSWVNSRGGSGTASDTSHWSVSDIALQSGANIITVTARDADGNTGSDSITVTYTPPDTQDPTATITNPTSSSSYATSSSTITLGGSASDNVGVTQVSWVNSRGGSGTASGTSSWSASSISLQSGTNIITVTARDVAGNTGSDSITVTYTPPDTQNPTATITNPTSSSSYDTSSSTITLGGSASDNVGVTQVSWVNSRGGSGTASGTSSWSASSISLQSGTNIITVTARDVAGNTGSDSITVTYTPPDTQNPTATITNPTSSSSYDTSSSTITLGGSASDNVGVTQVSWVNSRGGSGTASGTSSWSASSISLQSGTNIITVTARDVAGNTGSDSITVTYTPPDTQNPTVTITVPVPTPGYNTTESTITLGGSSSDNVGVTEVRWVNNRGGSGTASGTIMWSADLIPLSCGEDNIITLTAEDEAGNRGTDTLTVNVGPCKPGGLVVR